MEKARYPLVPGLPDDIALLCLARVPRRSHHLLRCVSKRWNASVSSEEFALCRKENNLQEAWVYAICLDEGRRNCCYVLDPCHPRRHWRRIPGVPFHCTKRQGMCVEALGTKLFLLGGCNWNEDATDEVYSYDALKNKWEQVASMPTARSFFVSTALNGVLCVTDALEAGPVNVTTRDIYDTISKGWKSFEDVNLGDSLSGWRRPWQNLGLETGKTEFQFGAGVVVDGSLYMLDQTSGTKLVRCTSVEEGATWEPVCRLSPLLAVPPCKLATVGQKIFVVGRCLSTVIVDVDEARKGGGLLFTSSSLSGVHLDLSVISCKTISI